MCTVTYIPTGKNQFVLTSNRDESPLRSPENITKKGGLIFPMDIKGGTWICASDENKLVCLLNGAFKKHKHNPPYPKSRGIIVMDFFDYPDTETFYQNYDLKDIEPFTMVIWDKGNLFQLRRDEENTYLTPLDVNESYLWSSAPLYDFPAKRTRQAWFEEWKKGKKNIQTEDVLDFHRNGGEKDDYNGFIMNRGFLKTISITQVINNGINKKMIYHDLLKDNISKEQLDIITNY